MFDTFKSRRGTEAYKQIQAEADRVRIEQTLESKLEELATYGKVSLRQHDKIFTHARIWYCIVVLTSKLPGVSGEVQGEEFDNPRDAVRSALERCRAALKR
jgi:hypothetical protein